MFRGMTTNINLQFRPWPNSFPTATHETDRGSYVVFKRTADFLVKFTPALPADLSKIEGSTKLGTFQALADVEAAIAEHVAAPPAIQASAPPPAHIPESSFGYRPAEILALARKLNVPGQLVKRYRSGRELRTYASAQPGNPWRVEARREEHYTGGE